jgi:hypothetical protein
VSPPILEGKLAARAWQAVRDIADDLAGVREPAVDLAIYWSYMAAVLDDALTAERQARAIERLGNVQDSVPGIGLHGGLAGIGWAVAHVCDDADALLDAIDARLIGMLASAEPWREPYDLIGGLVGVAVYFLERADAPAAQRGIELVVARLGALALRRDAGTTWFTPPVLLPPWQRELSPSGYYNCGMAHGVPGIVAVLAKIAERPGAPAAAGALRDEAARWVVAQLLDDGSLPSVVDETRALPGRTAWCYGSPGATIALWQAAARGGAIARADVEPMIARWLARGDAGVVDAPLCHGTSGLAHLCHRMFAATGDAAYRDAASTWFERTLALQRRGEPFGGFPAAMKDGWVASSNLLDGAAGVGLALLAALAPIEPTWDRLLLCDVPAR